MSLHDYVQFYSTWIEECEMWWWWWQRRVVLVGGESLSFFTRTFSDVIIKITLNGGETLINLCCTYFCRIHSCATLV
jgi:hypothetical protein